MPTYDFRCAAGHDFERFYGKISDSPSQTECPECGAVAERRISGGAGLLFKGSGFYITDYGKDGKKDQKAAAKPAAESGGSGAVKPDGGSSGGSSGGASGGSSKGEASSGAAAPTPSKPSKPAGGE